MNLTQKISQMTPKGADLAATDLIEVSTLEGGSYVTKSITGQELIDAIPLPPTGLTVGTTPIASGTIGRVLFQGTGNVVQESSSLFWDNTNRRLGLGTSTPDRMLVLQQDGGNFIRMVRNLSTTEFSMAITNVRLGLGSAGGVFSANEYEFRNSAGTSAFLTINSGNVLINTTTDAGFRLDVNGTARVSGDVLLTTGILASTNGTTRLQSVLNFFSHNRIGSSGVFGWDIRVSNNQHSFWTYDGASGNTRFGSNAYGVEFYTNNTLRTTITSGGNWLINTTTDAGFRLDVNGTARVRGTSLTDYGFTVANSANNLMFFGAGASNGGLPTISSATGRLMIYPTEGTLNRYVDFSNTSVRFNQLILEGEGGQNNINLSVGGSGALRLTTTISTMPIEFFTNNNNRASITASTGNFLIGTTTDAGYRLDVNGTARVQGPSGYSMTYDANGIFNLYGTYSRLDLFNSAGSLRARLNNDGPNGTLTLYQNATSYIFLNGAQSGNNSYIATALSIGNQSAANASSILELTSTTKGFLPPRMTTTQKNAIATPAAGLMVYDTDLTRPCFYNGTTWITL